MAADGPGPITINVRPVDELRFTMPVFLAPPLEPNRVEFPFVASCDFQGIPIDIEQRCGDQRSGVDADGTPWTVTMHAHYGEIRSHARGAVGTLGAKGMDGDRLDVYVGPNAISPIVVIVDQQVPELGIFDEQKVMLGFNSIAKALECYRKQYNHPGFYGGHKVVSIDELKSMIGNGEQGGRPLAKAIGKVLAKAAGGPFIGPRGGKWADPDHTIPWHPTSPRKRSEEAKSSHAPLYHDPTNNSFVATHAPASHYQPAHSMSREDFAERWQGASEKPSSLAGEDVDKLHYTEVVRAIRRGHDVHPTIAKQHDLHHALSRPKKASSESRMPGGKTWWKAYGWKSSPGWDGQWVDTTQHDPARYDKKGVKWAAKHMLRMRDLRSRGKIGRPVLEAIALFAITSIRTTAKAQERVWPEIDKWIAKGDTDAVDELVQIMRPLGVQNNRAKAFEKCKQAVAAYEEGMRKFGDHGPALRDWLVSHPDLKNAGLSNAKVSFTLELLGYSDVGCIDARVIQHMTGCNAKVAGELAGRLGTNGELYAEFEHALRRSQSFKESDPEPIRLGMAQWRMWDAEGGSDTTHKVLWDTMANITGVKDFRKAIAVGGVDAGLISAALDYSEARCGLSGPSQMDVVPLLSSDDGGGALAKAIQSVLRKSLG